MVARRATPLLVLAVLVAVMAGCGGDSPDGGGGAAASEQPPSTRATQEQPTPDGSAGDGQSCADIPVPGHEATGVRVSGATCGDAADIVAAAVGKGRRPYEAAGFACEPSPANGGDTDYACTQGQARVTFRYGAA